MGDHVLWPVPLRTPLHGAIPWPSGYVHLQTISSLTMFVMKAASLLFVFGTRPEAIKLCPLIRELRARPEFATHVCVTAQHRSMLDQVLQAFQITPDTDLNLMRPDQTLSGLTARILEALEPVFAAARPNMVIVQG